MKAIASSIFLSLMPLTAQAGLLDYLMCSKDITLAMKGKTEGKNVRFTGTFLHTEFMNKSSDHTITGVSVRLEGQCDDWQFRREYNDISINVKPGLSDLLLIETKLGFCTKINFELIQLFKINGC